MRDLNTDETRTDEDGFTLVEVLVVIVIISILTATVALNVIGRVDQAKIVKAKTDISNLSGAAEMYRLDLGRYPESLEDLVSPPRDQRLAERFQPGGYLDKPSLPMDPWDNEYIYVFPGEYGAFDIISYGEDGSEGGEDNNADVVSWER